MTHLLLKKINVPGLTCTEYARIELSPTIDPNFHLFVSMICLFQCNFINLSSCLFVANAVFPPSLTPSHMMFIWNILVAFINYVGPNLAWDSVKEAGKIVWKEKEKFQNLLYDSLVKAIANSLFISGMIDV